MTKLKEHTLVAGKDDSGFGILFNVLDNVDQVGHFREEGIIITESIGLFVVVTGFTNIQNRLDIRIHKPAEEDVSIFIYCARYTRLT